ncbi:MAG: DUF4911 domain-containing protein [Deltaproteobacteria bacterium]|nr:MAG: DUF4911 domain-containing protein [Deltaproteobacteria bacterium]
METVRRRFLVDRGEINYLRWTVESYDGMAVVRTVDPRAAVIEVMIAPGCEAAVLGLMKALREEEGMSIREEGRGPGTGADH